MAEQAQSVPAQSVALPIIPLLSLSFLCFPFAYIFVRLFRFLRRTKRVNIHAFDILPTSIKNSASITSTNPQSVQTRFGIWPGQSNVPPEPPLSRSSSLEMLPMSSLPPSKRHLHHPRRTKSLSGELPSLRNRRLSPSPPPSLHTHSASHSRSSPPTPQAYYQPSLIDFSTSLSSESSSSSSSTSPSSASDLGTRRSIKYFPNTDLAPRPLSVPPCAADHLLSKPLPDVLAAAGATAAPPITITPVHALGTWDLDNATSAEAQAEMAELGGALVKGNGFGGLVKLPSMPRRLGFGFGMGMMGMGGRRALRRYPGENESDDEVPLIRFLGSRNDSVDSSATRSSEDSPEGPALIDFKAEPGPPPAAESDEDTLKGQDLIDLAIETRVENDLWPSTGSVWDTYLIPTPVDMEPRRMEPDLIEFEADFPLSRPTTPLIAQFVVPALDKENPLQRGGDESAEDEAEERTSGAETSPSPSSRAPRPLPIEVEKADDDLGSFTKEADDDENIYEPTQYDHDTLHEIQPVIRGYENSSPLIEELPAQIQESAPLEVGMAASLTPVIIPEIIFTSFDTSPPPPSLPSVSEDAADIEFVQAQSSTQSPSSLTPPLLMGMTPMKASFPGTPAISPLELENVGLSQTAPRSSLEEEKQESESRYSPYTSLTFGGVISSPHPSPPLSPANESLAFPLSVADVHSDLIVTDFESTQLSKKDESSPIAFSTTPPSQMPTPPASPPLLPTSSHSFFDNIPLTSLSPLAMGELSLMSSSPNARPAWSVRASESPALGLPASSSTQASPAASRMHTPMGLGVRVPLPEVEDGVEVDLENDVATENEGSVNDIEIEVESHVEELGRVLLEVAKSDEQVAEVEVEDPPLPAFASTPALESSEVAASPSTDASTVDVATTTTESTPVVPSSVVPTTGLLSHRIPAQRPGPWPRSAIDIALAMQLRPGLGIGADPAWMVRFLMAMFGWLGVMISGGMDY